MGKTIDWTKPVRSMDGETPITVLYTEMPGPWPVVAIWRDIIVRYNLDGDMCGSFSPCCGVENVPVPPVKETVRVWLRRNKAGRLSVDTLVSEKNKSWEILGSKLVTITEGDE